MVQELERFKMNITGISELKFTRHADMSKKSLRQRNNNPVFISVISVYVPTIDHPKRRRMSFTCLYRQLLIKYTRTMY